MQEYSFFQGIAQAIEDVFGWHIPEKYIAIVFLSFCVLGILWLLNKFFIKPSIKNHKWRKNQLDLILKNHKSYMSRKERWLYIDTYFQTEPPHDYDEPSDSEYNDLRTKNDSIYHFLNKAFKKDNDNPPFYCILGGSGMGKTTFAVNLVRKYINKYKERTLPYPIKLLYCGANKEDGKLLIEDIRGIENKENTIIILDALDENNEAINNFSDFFPELLKAFKDFRIVVITCRTQFFESKNDEPSLLPFRDEKTKQLKQFKKYYVSPFSIEELNHYLNKKYILRFSKKKKAEQIVNKCKKLMARPLLLSFIDDLVNSDMKEFSISNIYEIIINKWLEREAKFATVENTEEYMHKLLVFSEEIAVYMAQTEYTKYNKKGFNQIIKKHTLNIAEKNLKGRSLLNRNSSDDYKFAHKSFMEYLVAKTIFEDASCNIDSLDCASHDMIPVFWADLFKTKLSVLGYNDWSISLTENLKNTIRAAVSYHSLAIRDIIWNNNLEFLLELTRVIKFNCIELYYYNNGNRDYEEIFFINLTNTIQCIKIFNYHFRDKGFFDIISRFLHQNEGQKVIAFYINDSSIISYGDRRVLYDISNPYFFSKQKLSVSIYICVFQPETHRYVPHTLFYDEKNNSFLLVKLSRDQQDQSALTFI